MLWKSLDTSSSYWGKVVTHSALQVIICDTFVGDNLWYGPLWGIIGYINKGMKSLLFNGTSAIFTHNQLTEAEWCIYAAVN